MHDHDKQNGSTGQSGIDSETQRRNQENETGEQAGGNQSQTGQSQGGQADYGSAGQQSDTMAKSQSGGASDALQGNPDRLSQTGSEGGSLSEGGSGFVGSGSDQTSDELTEGDNQDFQPEGQGATDTDAGTADITTGQPTSRDSSLDDGSDTSR